MARLLVRGVLASLMLALVSQPAAGAEAEALPYAACDKKATDGDMAAAKGAFEAGNAAFNEADYARAIIYWEDAYRRDCTAHALLLNLSRAYESNGQKRHAVVALETFNERDPGSSNRAQTEKRIAKLREAIAAEDAAAAAQPTTAPEADKPVAAPAPIKPAPSPEPATEDHYTALHWVSLGGAALGVIALGVGLPLMLTSKQQQFHDAFDPNGNQNSAPGRIVSEYGNEALAQTAFDELYAPATAPDVGTADGIAQITSDANAQATQFNIGGVVVITGAALAVVGTTLFFVLPKESTVVARLPKVAPVFGPDFAGVSFAGRF